MTMEHKISSMETLIPSTTSVYRRQSTLQVFDEVKELMDDLKLSIRNITESESESDKVPEERNSSMLLFPGELPAYLGRCYSIGPMDFLTVKTPAIRDRRIQKMLKLNAEFNRNIQKCFWRIPIKERILDGHVRKVGDTWNFYWIPGARTSDKCPNQNQKLILTATKSRRDGPCYVISSAFGQPKSIIGKLEGNSRLSKFSLYDDGLDMESLVNLHNNEGLEAVETKLDSSDDSGPRFIVQTRKELGIFLINRGHRISYFKAPSTRQVTLLLPDFGQRVKMQHENRIPPGFDAFSNQDWRNIPSLSIWEKFSGQMIRDVNDTVEDKNLVVEASDNSREDGFLVNVEKGPNMDNEYEVKFRSPLCFTQAFALTLTAIETNFK